MPAGRAATAGWAATASLGYSLGCSHGRRRHDPDRPALASPGATPRAERSGPDGGGTGADPDVLRSRRIPTDPGSVVITEAVAIRAYPELAQLTALRDAGWRFLPITDDEEQLDGLVGVRHWTDHTDALWIHDRTDTLAVRLLADAPGAPGGLLWQHAGPLADTTAALLELSAPGQPDAPTLLLARSLLDQPTPALEQRLRCP